MPYIKRISLTLVLAVFIITLTLSSSVNSSIIPNIIDEIDYNYDSNKYYETNGLLKSDSEIQLDTSVNYLTETSDYELIAGYGWTDTQTIQTNTPMNDIKVITDADDNVHVIWSKSTTEGYKLYEKILYVETNTWSDAIYLANSADDFTRVMDVVKDSEGKIHLVWTEGTKIQYKVYFDGEWSNKITIGYGYHPKIDIASSLVPKVIYTKSQSYNLYYIYAEFDSFYEIWTTQEIRTSWYSYDSYSYDFGISDDEGIETPFLMQGWYIHDYDYYTRQSYDYAIFEVLEQSELNNYFDEVSFHSEYEIDQVYYDLTKPVIETGNNGEVFVYYNYPTSTGSSEIFYRQKLVSSWTSSESLGVIENSRSYLTSTDDFTGRQILVWSNVHEVNMKIRDPYTEEWSDEATIYESSNTNSIPSSTTDSKGNIYVAWAEVDLDNVKLMFRKGLVDSDTDGLVNVQEQEEGFYYPSSPTANATGYIFTDPFNADSDFDQMNDGVEIANNFDPLIYDEDGDQMADGYEFNYGLDPRDGSDAYDDNDFDLLINIYEFLNGTLPNNNDTDSDALSDGEEVLGYYAPTNIGANATGYVFTNPLSDDTDVDELDDGFELLNLNSNPNSNDSDSDGMTDTYEYNWRIVLNILVDDSMDDPDGDNLINILEFENDIYPHDSDTDNDELDDYLEVIVWQTNPKNPDSDYDELTDGWEVNGMYYPNNPGSNISGYITTNPLLVDSDGDTLSDKKELNKNLNPNDVDTDDDLMSDNYEYSFKLDGNDPSDASVDYDGDGLINYQEFLYWTDPFDTDSDSDMILDNEELVLGTNPAESDTDADGLDDYAEIYLIKTDPLNNDTDSDGLTDSLEVYTYKSDPLLKDSDGDTLEDGPEVYTYGTDPASEDTDGDLLADNLELSFNSDPLDTDTDSDGMDDYFEWLYGFDPLLDDSNGDEDSDGVSNLEEFLHHANPLLSDTDGDGLNDYDEIVTYYTLPNDVDTDSDLLNDYLEIIVYKTSPYDPDTDDDNLLDGEEILYGTSPTNDDTDDDGVLDGQEVADGSDPLDPKDNTKITKRNIIIISFTSILGGVSLYYVIPLVISKIFPNVELKWVKEGVEARQQKGKSIIKGSSLTSSDK